MKQINVMNKLLKLLICTVCLLLCGCKKDAVSTGALLKLAEVRSVPAGKWSTHIESLQFIPLETNEQSLIGRINKIGYLDDVIYVLSDYKKLSAFRADGSYLRNYGAIGNGPGELESFMDFDVDQENVYIIGYNKVSTFSKDGTFQKETNLKAIPSAIKKTKDGMLFYLSTPVGEDCLAYMDAEGNWSTTLQKNEPLRLNRPNSWLRLPDGNFIFQKGYSMEAVLFREDCQQFEDIDLTDAPTALTLAEQEQIQKEQGSKGLFDSGKILYDGLTSSASQLIFGSGDKNGTSWYLRDLEQNKTCSFIVSEMEDDVTFTEGKFLDYASCGYSNGAYLLSYLEADVLREVFLNHEENPNYPLVMKLPDESNPVIVLFRLKD